MGLSNFKMFFKKNDYVALEFLHTQKKKSIIPIHSQLTYGGGGRPYSSLALRDYDPLMSDTYGMDQSRSYLGGRSLSGGAASSLDGHLRDTAISGLGSADPYDDRSRFLASRRFVGNATRNSSSARGHKLLI